MRNLLRYLFLIPIGYLLGCCAAAWVVAVGVYGTRFDIEVIGYFTATVVLMSGWAATYAFLPALAVILAAEFLKWRSVLFWTAFGGGLALIGYLGPYARSGLPGDNDYRLAFLAGGFVGGFVYWLIAGRLSGERAVTGSAPPAA
jgi:hypothetical protein